MLELLWAVLWPLMMVAAIWIGVKLLFSVVEGLFDLILWLLVLVAMLAV